ncbi:hypothetical protein CGRA01v4_04221 [Colletotrichum graminicola]|nr:hypothetical protein CGRA01v4_04221 [Colletotrichum graminicola]
METTKAPTTEATAPTTVPIPHLRPTARTAPTATTAHTSAPPSGSRASSSNPPRLRAKQENNANERNHETFYGPCILSYHLA